MRRVALSEEGLRFRKIQPSDNLKIVPRYRCTGCDQDKDGRDFHEYPSRGARGGRPVTSRCRACRREDRYAVLHPMTTCPACLLHRPLDGNGECSSCNAARGLKECASCRKICVIELDFYRKQGVCHRCRRALKT